MTQSDILLKHLSTVFDPELGANIVELGMVKAVDHEGSTVKIDLALTIADCPMRNQIEKEIIQKKEQSIFLILKQVNEFVNKKVPKSYKINCNKLDKVNANVRLLCHSQLSQKISGVDIVK